MPPRRWASCGSPMAMCTVASHRSCRRSLAIRRRRCLSSRRSAGCTSRATSSPASSRRKRRLGVDYGFFYLPPIDEQYGKPFLVAGDIMAMFNDRPEVRAIDGVLHRAAVSQGLAGDGWSAGDAQDCHTGDVRCGPGARHCRVGFSGYQLPLRRLGPDAG